jgi:hypothetical protein
MQRLTELYEMFGHTELYEIFGHTELYEMFGHTELYEMFGFKDHKVAGKLLQDYDQIVL